MKIPMQAKGVSSRRITAPGRSRGRPRAFDREVALDRALGLFWTRGFEGTSISDLTDALDINPPSLYAAFGSKEELFREALGLYVRAYGIPIERAIAEEKTALDVIVRILLEAARLFPAGATPGGCLVSSGSLNCAPALIRPLWPGMSRPLFRVCQYKRGTEPMRRPCWRSQRLRWLPGHRVRDALSSAVQADGLDERVDKESGYQGTRSSVG